MAAPEYILDLSLSDRRAAFNVAAFESGRAAHVLEKDVWVVWSLNAIFESLYGEHFSFKGGTSLSKAFKVIDRFSEDVDLTYNIQKLLPEAEGDPEVAPRSSSHARTLTKKAKKRLPEFIEGTMLPILKAASESFSEAPEIRFDSDAKGVKLKLHYPESCNRSSYMEPVVLLEFGARSTGKPSSPMEIGCDAAPYLSGLRFPVAEPRVMSIERTFWEKVTAIHTFCCHCKDTSRLSRHWFDVVRIIESKSDVAKSLEIARQVVAHKSLFHFDRAVNLDDAISGNLQLVPQDDLRSALKDDYQRMLQEGFLSETAYSFEPILFTDRAT